VIADGKAKKELVDEVLENGKFIEEVVENIEEES